MTNRTLYKALGISRARAEVIEDLATKAALECQYDSEIIKYFDKKLKNRMEFGMACYAVGAAIAKVMWKDEGAK